MIAHRRGVAQGNKWLGEDFAESGPSKDGEEVNICLPCRSKINAVVRSNLGAGGSRREAVRSLNRVLPAVPTLPPLPQLIGEFESCRLHSAAAPSLPARSGLSSAVRPSVGGRWDGWGRALLLLS